MLLTSKAKFCFTNAKKSLELESHNTENFQKVAINAFIFSMISVAKIWNLPGSRSHALFNQYISKLGESTSFAVS